MFRRAIAVVLFIVFGTAVNAQSSREPSLAVPLEPIGTVLDAFRTHEVVALGEGDHGNEQGHAFRLALIRDPRFAALVNDIVVEFGNSRYQDVMNRFVRGEEIADETLRRTWQDTTQGDVWDRPIYEEFFRAVRAINATSPSGKRLRVLLGDPPIDWRQIHDAKDWAKWRHLMADRDSFPAALIQREVLAKHRRALVIYGDGHLSKTGLISPSLVRLLPSNTVFNIATPTYMDLEKLQPGTSEWPHPSLVPLKGTMLGMADAANDFSLPGRMEDQFDALLYLGPPPTITFSKIPRTLCADPSYVQMRLARMRLAPPPGSVQPKPECLLPENTR